MSRVDDLSEREVRVLDSVIQLYIETAEPAGSQAVVARSRLGVSSATIRNTMSDLETRGYLFHPHTSSGRIPTDLAYRAYVDRLMHHAPPKPEERERIETETDRYFFAPWPDEVGVEAAWIESALVRTSAALA